VGAHVLDTHHAAFPDRFFESASLHELADYGHILEKDAKGKLCGGHLKRWYYTTDVVEQGCGDVAREWGPDAEVYRCEHCKTLYLPNPEEEPRTGTLSF